MAKWMPEMNSTPQTTSSMNFVGFLVSFFLLFRVLSTLKRNGEGTVSTSTNVGTNVGRRVEVCTKQAFTSYVDRAYEWQREFVQ